MTRLEELRKIAEATLVEIPPHNDCYFDEPCSQQEAHVAFALARNKFSSAFNAQTCLELLSLLDKYAVVVEAAKVIKKYNEETSAKYAIPLSYMRFIDDALADLDVNHLGGERG